MLFSVGTPINLKPLSRVFFPALFAVAGCCISLSGGLACTLPVEDRKPCQGKAALGCACYLEAARRPFTEAAYQDLFRDLPGGEKAYPAYAGAYQGLVARDLKQPWARYQWTRKATTNLNLAVQRDPHNPEWRFLRWLLEKEIPTWLGWSAHVAEDQAFLDVISQGMGNGVGSGDGKGSPKTWLFFYSKAK